MKSEIRRIRVVNKFGAFGNRNNYGEWIYGERPDGRVVPCENSRTPSGGKKIWSFWVSPSCKEHEIDCSETEFSKEEWERISRLEKGLQPIECEKILRARGNDPGHAETTEDTCKS